MIHVWIAGATGWAGRALVDGVLAADDMVLRYRERSSRSERSSGASG